VFPLLVPSPRTPAAGFIFVTVLLDVVGIGLTIPVLPPLIEQMLGGDESDAALVFGPLAAQYSVLQTLFSPLLGALSDRFGRRPVILLALVGMGLSYVSLGFAPTVPWLFVARGFAGITGATVSTANAYMADISTPETRSRNFGLIGAAFGLGFVLGPAMGGLLGSLGPRVPFFAAAAVSLLNALWGLFVLPESLPPEQRRSFTWQDLDPTRGVRHLATQPMVAGLALVFVIQSVAQRGVESVWVLYTSWRYGWTELHTGLSLAVVGVLTVLVQAGLVRRVVPALGEARALLVGLVLNGVALALYGIAPAGWVVLAIIPIGALSGISGPALQGLITARVEPQRQGAVQGGLVSAQSLTSIVAPLLATALFAWGTDGTLSTRLPGLPFFVSAALLGLAWLQALRVLARLR
jgi:DHA1 family tetracycline resistance protein-like MFS transporter